MELLYTVKALEGYCGIIPGRNILFSSGVGDWKPEYVEALTNNLLELAKKFNGKSFAYIADPSRMNPILSKEVSAKFAALHGEVEKIGCKAVAFLDGNTAAMKLQSQKHQNQSEAKGLQVLHFKTVEDALDWFNEMGL